MIKQIFHSSSKNRSDMALGVPPRAIYHFMFFSLSWNICQLLVNGSPDVKTVMREIELKQANYFQKVFLTKGMLSLKISSITF